MHIYKETDAKITNEYDCEFRRLYPIQGIADSPWGSAWAKLQPGERSKRHSHDEMETFIVLSGEGEITAGDEIKKVSRGDVVYFPPFVEHTLLNISKNEKLEFLCIWWGGEESRAAS